MKEKDYIEKLITTNLEELNDNEPNEGHFNRFEEKLNKQNKGKIISLNLILRVAAVVVFALLIFNQAFIYFSSDKKFFFNIDQKNQPVVTLASVAPEYEEVEFYYNNAINVVLNQWEGMIGQGLISEEDQILMNKELSDFEDMFAMLQKDLEANPTDERVINAMLEYYRTKLSIINMILNKLEEVKQKSNTDYETEI